MVLTRWDPLFEIRRARRLANRRWAGFPASSGLTGFSDAAEQRDWSIPLDILRDGDNVTVTANLPGVNLEDIDVTIEGGVLTIKAEPRYENGVLSITLPVAESKKAKHLTVAVGAALPGGQ